MAPLISGEISTAPATFDDAAADWSPGRCETDIARNKGAPRALADEANAGYVTIRPQDWINVNVVPQRAGS